MPEGSKYSRIIMVFMVRTEAHTSVSALLLTLDITAESKHEECILTDTRDWRAAVSRAYLKDPERVHNMRPDLASEHRPKREEPGNKEAAVSIVVPSFGLTSIEDILWGSPEQELQWRQIERSNAEPPPARP